MDFFYAGHWRMDWGFGNPNKTAALIAILMVAVWILAYIRKWGFWAALILFVSLGVCLIQTFSRGGIIALSAGLAVMAWKTPRPWPQSRIIAATASIWIMIAFSFIWKAPERFSKGIEGVDPSITHRLEIWEKAPQMMVDAPWGWGLGKSGQAYMEWYQPVDRGEEYRTLVNSHLTWLVEWGWPLRFLYLSGWIWILILCWPSRGEGIAISPVPLGIWTTFAVASFFSSVAESPWLWIVPAVGFLGALLQQVHQKRWKKPLFWLAPPVLAFTVLVVLYLFGHGKSQIHGSPDRVIVGGGVPKTWILAAPKRIGKNYGKNLRRYLQTPKGSSIGIVESVATMPVSLADKTLVVFGSAPRDQLSDFKKLVSTAKKTILINPLFYPQEIHLSRENRARLEVFFGEFSQSPTLSAWADSGPVTRIKGAGDFLPNWPEVFLAKRS